LQAKLRIGEAGDALERDADVIADRVMRAPAAAAAVEPPGATLQRRATNRAPATEAPAVVHEALGAPGGPLDADTRDFMEARFGQDFGGVRVHADDIAAKSAEAVDALAYTVGDHVVFGRSRYAPSSAAGRHLLAHELAHTIQQKDRRVLQRAPGPGGTTTTAQASGNCSVAAGSALTTAITTALDWLRTAINALHGFEALPLSRSTAATATALQFHFHTTNPFHAALIRTRLQQVLDGMRSPQGAPSDCAAPADAGCGPATVAYHQRGHVVWCPFLFELDASGQARTIVHEYTHAEARRLPLVAGFAEFSGGQRRRIEDRAYLDRRYYLDLTPSEAMDNADSYSNLVRDLGTGTASAQAPSERAEDRVTGCSPAQQELIRESLSIIHRWNDATRYTLKDTSLPSYPILDRDVTAAIEARFGTPAPARADLAAVYEAASTPLLLGFSLACDGATGACQSPAVHLWQSGTGGAIHICPGWIAQPDALQRHRHLYTQVLSNAGAVTGNSWSYVDLARDLEGLHLEINEPPPPVPADPFPQSTVPGTAIG
jgi:Domain of unknown function (DUF4157)